MATAGNGVFYYDSSMGSAPALDNSVGTLITVLDACLVNGFGGEAAAGWTKAFSGTNKAVYQSSDVAGTQLYLRVDDTYGSYARVRGYETMSDVDTGTGLFPTDAQLSGGGYVLKSSSGTVDWTLFADSRAFYFHPNYFTWQSAAFFGDIASYISPDAFCCGLLAHDSNSVATMQLNLVNSAKGFLARSYLQTGESITQYRYTHGKNTTFIGDASGVAYPIAGIGFLGWPIEVWDSTSQPRGQLPGVWSPVHDDVNLPQGTVISDVPQLSGRDLIVQTIRSGRLAFDITGPWR